MKRGPATSVAVGNAFINFRHLFLGTALSLALSGAHAAPDGANAKAAPTSDGPVQLETVTVTATRRAELSRNVPLTITALSPIELKDHHVSSFDDLAERVPGIHLTSPKGPALTEVFMRGQGTSSQSPGLDTPGRVFPGRSVLRDSRIAEYRLL